MTAILVLLIIIIIIIIIIITKHYIIYAIEKLNLRMILVVIMDIYTYRIFRSKICLNISTCDYITADAKRGSSVSLMRVPACSVSSSLGATGGSMTTRRCSYTAAFKLKLAEYAERHGARDPPRAACCSVANVCVK